MGLDTKSRVWNRAALESGGDNPGEGDQALAALLLAHSLIMNGGVEHALEVLSPQEVEAAVAGFRYFSLNAVGDLLKMSLEGCPEDVDLRYGKLIPEDGIIIGRFEAIFLQSPEAFTPLRDRAD